MGSVLRFAGFELDQSRAELRTLSGASVRLRSKAFDLLWLFAVNPGRILSKHELMSAVWPNTHVGEDSLFQCVREVRIALEDDERRLLKAVSGRGYLFDAEVSGEPDSLAAQADLSLTPEQDWRGREINPPAAARTTTGPARRRLALFGLQGRAATLVACLCAVIGLAVVAAQILLPRAMFQRKPPVIAVMPFGAAGSAPQATSMAANVTSSLVDGLSRIATIRVVAAGASTNASTRPTDADFKVSGELQFGASAWTLETRMTDVASGEVRWTATTSVGTENAVPALQQSRLVAGVGHELAIRIDALLYPGDDLSASGLQAGDAKIVVNQAIASINRTTRERFATAQEMLEGAQVDEPDNVDLQVALAALQTRGIQMNWYSAAESATVESNARLRLERALQARPSYLPGLEAYCRFLTATNNFVESLVTCARVLNHDPWDGSALYQLGLTQIQLGRFEDALATFMQANRFDTPAVSRWTWLLGAGWADLLLGNHKEAVEWLERSIAITPASGRPYLLLAAALQQSERPDEAKAALAKAMTLRPHSTALNIAPPSLNASPVFLEASQRVIRILVEMGLPDR